MLAASVGAFERRAAWSSSTRCDFPALAGLAAAAALTAAPLVALAGNEQLEPGADAALCMCVHITCSRKHLDGLEPRPWPHSCDITEPPDALLTCQSALHPC